MNKINTTSFTAEKLSYIYYFFHNDTTTCPINDKFFWTSEFYNDNKIYNLNEIIVLNDNSFYNQYI